MINVITELSKYVILKEFRTVYQENGKPSGRRYTKGHFKRGAE